MTTAMRMLDNVIDINFYTIPEARRSNLRHRPVGLGIMGFQDALHMLRHAVCFRRGRRVRRRAAWRRFPTTRSRPRSILPPSAGAIRRSRVAVERRASCRSTPSNCSAEARGGPSTWIAPARSTGTACARRVRSVGMRNSNVMAIAPTATISNICGVSQSIEPAYQNLYVKSNMSGDFTVVNALSGA